MNSNPYRNLGFMHEKKIRQNKPGQHLFATQKFNP